MTNAALKGDQIAHQLENKPNGYLALATRAAELEREERYSPAMSIWVEAKKAAKNALNKEWASHRAELCLTCVTRFGKRKD